MRLEEMVKKIGPRFGVLAESDTQQLTVIAVNTDVAVGDIFLLPCNRGRERFYVFRTTQYANILNRTLEMNDVARNKLTLSESYFAEDLRDEQLIELKGMVLGYSEREEETDRWVFHKPRRLPQHLSDVFQVTNDPEMDVIMNLLFQNQVGTGGLYVGDLLAGENALKGVRIHIPAYAFSHHIGIFGRTGCGKSNLMMVLLESIMRYNQAVEEGAAIPPKVSIFAIDPHDEFKLWHQPVGGEDGLHGIVHSYNSEEQIRLVAPFYYLTLRNRDGHAFEQRIRLSRADLMPDDFISVMEFSEQQSAFAQSYYSIHGERWVGNLLMGDVEEEESGFESGTAFLPGTVAAVRRRVSCLRQGNTRLFTRFDPEMGLAYDSTLPDIICALEKGRVLDVDTTLMTEVEQFLLNTVVARVLFSLRKALRSAESPETLPDEIRKSLGNDPDQMQVGMQTLAELLLERLQSGDLPYLNKGELVSLDQLPYVNIVIEEAPSILNPQRMRFGSVFRDISRQGRKFGIGLTVISQQVSEIDQGILTQINTEFNMALGNENERREAIRNASSDLQGFEKELQVMAKGQTILSASYKDVPMPIQVPEF
jgi:hypothetical protein